MPTSTRFDRPRRRPRLLWIIPIVIVVYPCLVFLMRLTDFVELPNRAVLVRTFEWGRWTRVDLARSPFGERLARDIDYLCFDDRAIQGYTLTGGGFVWLGGDAPVVGGGDATFFDVWRESGLNPPGKGCLGYFGMYVGGGLLLSDPRYAWWRAKPDEKPRSNVP